MKANALQLGRLTSAVGDLRERALKLEQSLAGEFDLIEPQLRDSARNLAHYLAVRQQDIRQLQEELSALGLSSLGRMEAHTMATLQSVLSALGQLAGIEDELPSPATSFHTGSLLLEEHTSRLLGPAPRARKVRIMVTMPTEAATDPAIVRDLLSAGMNVMRVNCAHDEPETWLNMIRHMRAAERELGRSCRVLADLGGPKLRTGAIHGNTVTKIRPGRDVRGRVTQRARVTLTSGRAGVVVPEGSLTIEIDDAALGAMAPGDRLRLVDTRGRKRRLVVTGTDNDVCTAETDRTIYLEVGLDLVITRKGEVIANTSIMRLSPTKSFIELDRGDMLWLTLDDDVSTPALRDESGTVVTPAVISPTLTEAFGAAAVGQAIFFDDGKIGGRIERIANRRIEVRITQTPPGGAKLGAEKGINLPDTRIDIQAVTPTDVEALRVLTPHIDLVGLSFVRTPEDVEALQECLQSLGADHLGIMLKIENRIAFSGLPKLLLTAMRSPRVGVMLARGDLAVEVGYERLSEVQEEILWICEAAHVPVIWATQVLEDLAKKGIPSRSEVTDAAMSGRAECVMLNKGPHIVRAVELLNRILDRMGAHQIKKTAMMRELAVSNL